MNDQEQRLAEWLDEGLATSDRSTTAFVGDVMTAIEGQQRTRRLLTWATGGIALSGVALVNRDQFLDLVQGLSAWQELLTQGTAVGWMGLSITVLIGLVAWSNETS